MNLTWKYSYRSSTLKFFEGPDQVGFLKANIWTPFIAQGELYGKQYVFKPTDFFGKILILNAETKGVEGFINRGLHPTIKLGDEQSSKLNFKNFWMTKWRLVGNQAYRIQFTGGYFKGKFSWNEEIPTAIILASFYARNKVWEMGFFILTILAIWLSSKGL